MIFYLTTKNIATIITIEKPILPEDSTVKQNATLRKWTEDDFLCKNYILNGVFDNLYDYYANFNTVKDVWETFQNKYDTEEVRVKKFAINRYLKYQMTDDKSVKA